MKGIGILILAFVLCSSSSTTATAEEITACVGKSGKMTLIGPGYRRVYCRPSETQLTFNTEGPQGPQGEQGPQGSPAPIFPLVLPTDPYWPNYRDQNCPLVTFENNPGAYGLDYKIKFYCSGSPQIPPGVHVDVCSILPTYSWCPPAAPANEGPGGSPHVTRFELPFLFDSSGGAFMPQAQPNGELGWIQLGVGE